MKQMAYTVIALITNLIIFNILLTVKCFTIDLQSDYRGVDENNCNNGECIWSSRRGRLRGLFYTESEINMLDNINNGAIRTPVENEEFLNTDTARLVTDDGDACCPTYIKHLYKETMVNIFDEPMTILNLTVNSQTTSQYIPHASCLRVGSCGGDCVLEYKTITLLGYDENHNTRFDFFSIPGYCSCKNSFDN